MVKICSGTAGEIMRDTDKSRRGSTEIYGFISRRSSYDPERKCGSHGTWCDQIKHGPEQIKFGLCADDSDNNA